MFASGGACSFGDRAVDARGLYMSDSCSYDENVDGRDGLEDASKLASSLDDVFDAWIPTPPSLVDTAGGGGGRGGGGRGGRCTGLGGDGGCGAGATGSGAGFGFLAGESNGVPLASCQMGTGSGAGAGATGDFAPIARGGGRGGGRGGDGGRGEGAGGSALSIPSSPPPVPAVPWPDFPFDAFLALKASSFALPLAAASAFPIEAIRARWSPHDRPGSRRPFPGTSQ